MTFPDWFGYWFARLDLMPVLGVFLLTMFCWILLQAQMNRRNKIDLSYLLVDSTINNVTLAKFGGLMALVASTWVFIYLPVSGHFDSAYAIGYIVGWGAVKVATDFSKTKEG